MLGCWDTVVELETLMGPDLNETCCSEPCMGGVLTYMGVRSALPWVWKPGLSQDLGGLSPPCIFTTTQFACALKTIQFFSGNQNSVRENMGQREPPQRGKRQRRGRRAHQPQRGLLCEHGDCFRCWARRRGRGGPCRHTSHPNKLTFLVRKIDSDQ